MDEAADRIRIEEEFFQWHQIAAHACGGRCPGGKMEVGAAKLDGLPEIIGDFAYLTHNGWG